jgi:hypothetical protein
MVVQYQNLCELSGVEEKRGFQTLASKASHIYEDKRNAHFHGYRGYLLKSVTVSFTRYLKNHLVKFERGTTRCFKTYLDPIIR